MFQNIMSNEIDLKNYYPHRITHDSVIYVHNRFMKGKQEKVGSDKAVSVDSVPQEGKRSVVGNLQKEHSYKICDRGDIKMERSDQILQKTIDFAKNIAPIAMPPSQEKVPVYTIKTCKKHRKKNKNSPIIETNGAQEECVINKFEKKVEDTYRKEKRKFQETLIIREPTSQTSQSNTLDEINISQSLTCSSSMSENKTQKKCYQSQIKNSNNTHKFAVSESFEALATERMNGSGDNKIKIHLMNDNDKYLFREGIKGPIITAIKECLHEITSKTESNDDLANVQKIAKRNTQVLENILEKLENIERKIDSISKHNTIVTKPCKPKPGKSILESLEEDIFDVNTKLEDVHRPQSAENRRAANNSVVILSPIKEKKEKAGDGEDVTYFTEDSDEVTRKASLGEKLKSTSNILLGSKLERPNRIPAGFCWTDAGKRQ